VKLVILTVNLLREDKMSGLEMLGDGGSAAPADQCAYFTFDQPAGGIFGCLRSRTGNRQPMAFRELVQAFEAQRSADNAAGFGRQGNDNANGRHDQ